MQGKPSFDQKVFSAYVKKQKRQENAAINLRGYSRISSSAYLASRDEVAKITRTAIEDRKPQEK